jgi:hypothetical protein
MQGVAQEELDDHFPRSQLVTEAAEGRLIPDGRDADRELLAELPGQLLPESERPLIIDDLVLPQQAERGLEFLLREALHADQHPATTVLGPRPTVDLIGDQPPAAQVEVAHAEIGARGFVEGLPDRGQQVLADIVEYSRHDR